MTPFFRIATSAAVAAFAFMSVAAQAEIAHFDPKTSTYCVRTEVTGSLIPQRVCASRQQWIDRGATIVVATPRPAAPIEVATR